MKLVECINCQHGGNNPEGEFICFEIKSNFWWKNVLKTVPDCEFFLPLIEVGERVEVTYPIELLNK
jgi:hypothetical protein